MLLESVLPRSGSAGPDHSITLWFCALPPLRQKQQPRKDGAPSLVRFPGLKSETWGTQLSCHNPQVRAFEILRLAAESASRFNLEQELQRFEVAAGLGYRFSPSIKPVAGKKNAVGIGIIG